MLRTVVAVATCGGLSKPRNVVNRTLVVDDPLLGLVNRTYQLLSPPAPPRSPAPLVIGFHGQGHLASEWAEDHSFDSLATDDKWYVVYPQGLADGGAGDFDSGWNVGTN